MNVSLQKPLHGVLAGKVDLGRRKDLRRSWNDNIENRIPQMAPQVSRAVQCLYLMCDVYCLNTSTVTSLYGI